MKINFHARYGEFSEKKHIKPAPPNPPKSVYDFNYLFNVHWNATKTLV